MSILTDIYDDIPANAKVFDVGCWGFPQYKFAQSIGRLDIIHFGVDYSQPEESIPTDYTFKLADLNKVPIPFDDDQFDLVNASHIMEHLNDPIHFFSECIRVCKPGGKVFIETPSERSFLLPGFPFQRDKFFSTSYYDDPTHTMRPWTAQSLYRLTKYYSCDPVKVGYHTSWKMRLFFPIIIPWALIRRKGWLLEKCIWGMVGWASYLVAQKPATVKGAPSFHYYIPPR
jgi:SAM-dependent methyltransferase